MLDFTGITFIIKCYSKERNSLVNETILQLQREEVDFQAVTSHTQALEDPTSLWKDASHHDQNNFAFKSFSEPG